MRERVYVAVQQILACDLPAVNLWYVDTLVLHNRRMTHGTLMPSGSYAFLETAELAMP
jgi:peptide/nickel transport system substrate-binding protein